MTLLNGKQVSKTIKNNLKSEVQDLIETTGIVPSLSIILVGSNPASEIYVRNKIKAANYCGINANLIRKDEDIQEEELVNLVNQLNEDQSCHGIIVQLPLPKHINEQKVIDAISYTKDVDGFGIINFPVNAVSDFIELYLLTLTSILMEAKRILELLLILN